MRVDLYFISHAVRCNLKCQNSPAKVILPFGFA